MGLGLGFGGRGRTMAAAAAACFFQKRGEMGSSDFGGLKQGERLGFFTLLKWFGGLQF